MRLKQVEFEIKNEKRSFWDYTVLQEKQAEIWRQNNAQAIQAAHSSQVDNPPPPEQPPTPEGVTPPEPSPHLPPKAPALIPAVTAEPPKIDMPPMLKIVPLPVGEIDVPEEPEYVDTVRTYVHPETGAVIFEEKERLFLVPTDCRKPAYLNPFESTVECQDVLPKDEALQAQLYGMYQTNGWVDEEWCQDRIPEIATDATDIRKRMKAKKAMEDRLQPVGMTKLVGNEQTTYGGQLAPAMESPTAIPGPGGNPTPQGQQIQPPQPGV